ncbi:MAG: CHAT domain-containing protein [Fimbriimonadaceae bacterium]|jgi:CHAT domain-containing protein/Tfp pilus assembly protein PilF|nr:CHAT domain-containing protein [Fimbriimonadaceae bacterium]
MTTIPTLVLLASLGQAQATPPVEPQPTPEISREIARIRQLPDQSKQLEEFRKLKKVSEERNDSVGKASCQLWIAFILSRFSPKDSLKEYALAIELLTNVGSTEFLAYAYNNRGVQLADLGRPSEAIRDYEAALKLREKLGQPDQLAITYDALGAAYENLGDHRKALAYLQQALEIWQTLTRLRELAVTYNRIGLVHYSSGNPALAITFYEKASPIFQAEKDWDSLAALSSNTGLAFIQLGKLDKAYDSLTRSNELRVSHGAALYTPNELTIFRVFHSLNMGTLFITMGNQQAARGHFLQALEFSAPLNQPRLKGAAYTNLGALYLREGQNKEAIDMFTKALAEDLKVGNPLDLSMSYSHLGSAYARSGQLDKALENHQEALRLAEGTATPHSLALIYNNLGESYYLAQQPQLSREHFQTALRYTLVDSRIDLRSTILSNLMVLESAEAPSLAIVYGKKSVEDLQTIGGSLLSMDLAARRKYRDSVSKTYKYLSSLLISQGRFMEAEEVLNLLKEAESDAFQDNRDAITAQRMLTTLELSEGERDFITNYIGFFEEIVKIDEELQTLNKVDQRTEAQNARRRELQAKITDINQTREKFLATVLEQTKANPGTWNPNNDIAASRALQRPLQELQQKAGLRAAVLRYVVTDNEITVLVTTSNLTTFASFDFKTEGAQLKVSSLKDLNQMIFEFRTSLISPKSNPLPNAKILYDILLKKIEKELKDRKIDLLIVSPDGSLRNFPFAALSRDGKTWLGHEVNIANFSIHSSTRFAESGDKNLTTQFFGMTDPARVSFVGTDYSFSPLPNVTREAELVARFSKTEKTLNQAFTRLSLTDYVLSPSQRILHIASHFERGLRADTSFLLLGDKTVITQKDLTVQGMNLKDLDLLVLSACDTATEQPPSLLDVQGRAAESFADGLLEEGAKTVIASLWKVNDSSTADLMGELYKHLSQGKSKAEALRLAMRATAGLKDAPSEFGRSGALEAAGPTSNQFPGKSHPYYWAPFVLYGSPL